MARSRVRERVADKKGPTVVVDSDVVRLLAFFPCPSTHSLSALLLFSRMSRLFVSCAVLLLAAAAVTTANPTCNTGACVARCTTFALEGLSDTRPVSLIFDNEDFWEVRCER
jgi:hypothetical protein